MEVYLVRHGIAVEHGAPGIKTDAARMLTEEGREKTAEAAAGAAVAGCVPARIVTSPLVRARETAEIMAARLAPGIEVEELDLLAPAVNPAQTAKWLSGRDEEAIMLVGHMPDMAELTSALLSADAVVDIMFKKAAIACVSFWDKVEPGKGCLKWLLQPRQLRLLGHPPT